MSQAAVNLVNAAISRQGGNLIVGTDFTGTTAESVLASLNYEQTVRTELENDPYRFARKTAACTLQVDGDDDPIVPIDISWKYAWNLPSDVLKLRTVMRNGLVIAYEIDSAGVILTNYSDAVYAIYTYRSDESVWPSDFVEGITCRFEAIYLRSDDRAQEAAERDEAAEAFLARARLNHSQEETPTDPRVYPLIAARRVGYGPCRR